MSALFAVRDAVDAQLTYDRHWPPRDPGATMGANYGYILNTISIFLRDISIRLRRANYEFEFDQAFASAAITKTVAELMGEIEANTTSLPMATMGASITAMRVAKDPVKKKRTRKRPVRAVPKKRSSK